MAMKKEITLEGGGVMVVTKDHLLVGVSTTMGRSQVVNILLIRTW
jgi:arginine deiminase